MAKTKKQSAPSTGILIVLAAVFAVLLGMLVFSMQGAKSEIHADMGPLQYKTENGKAVMRTDAAVNDLKKFLEIQGKESGCPAAAYHNVIAASTDEKQVLLAFGCDYPGARMFAVNTDNGWRTISPTNQFDEFGVPACEHVNQNNIATSIGPVCFERRDQASGVLKYIAR